MLIKSFEGTNMSDITRRIKKEFGPEATILETIEKTLEPGNKTKHYEVRAAVHDPAKERVLSGASSTRSGSDINQNMLEELMTDLTSLNRQFKRLQEDVCTLKEFGLLDRSVKELKLLVTQSLKSQDATFVKDLPEPLFQIHQHLTLMGVDSAYSLELMHYLKSLPVDNPLPDGFESLDIFYKSHAMRWLMKRISVQNSIQPQVRSIHLFMGSTGSGKTTTIAKLASFLKKQGTSKILLASFDQVRIAASEQLRVYAKILDLSFVTINDPLDLKEKIAQYNPELVLIDTSGRSAKSEGGLLDLKNMLAGEIPIQSHLVLSMTERSEQIDQNLRFFSTLGINSLIFTKLDEAWKCGDLFNMPYKWSVPLSFFTTGQHVPNDFEVSTKERVMERIFSL